ncbi:general secretion pathway protein E [Fluviicoccus keumensis]|uniref:General secretion pathway protein E n=1 Tax=Fluviicoccus keumensis TaxID=1435465 RepID=A0A4Q7YGX1_9GAMM|nr:GspE/PulE family protein [Fluviicoccus keumensis]RZU36742.1 general secretion pathway protein E [Fluviicoccus keumensis]
MNQPDLFISTGRGDQESVELLNDLFAKAAEHGASDIHFEDHQEGAAIRWRCRGSMELIGHVSRHVARNIQDKIRARCNLSIVDKKLAQDGRTSLQFASFGLDLRVSIQPTVQGHSVVCRLLDQRNAGRPLNDIPMTDIVRSSLMSVIHEPNGLFLVTGPTGSGKTSTLYSIINALNSVERKIMTIEDPVEYRLPWLQQVNVEQDNPFASALRAALRQDPDVILVGEIRDRETANIAIQAALTGHLVLSTLHANDSVSTISRLLDLDVDPVALAASLRGVLAQRLVKRLPVSSPNRPATRLERDWLLANRLHSYVDQQFGSPEEHVAYQGMLPVMELLLMSPAIQEAMVRRQDKRIRQIAGTQPQFETLARAGTRLAASGMTSLEEIIAISGQSLQPTDMPLGERLISLGHLTSFQLRKALNHQISGSQCLLGEILIDMQLCDKEAIDEAMAII